MRQRGQWITDRSQIQSALRVAVGEPTWVHHPHPYEIAEPSQADVPISCRLREVLQLADTPVLDHLIVANGDVIRFVRQVLL